MSRRSGCMPFQELALCVIHSTTNIQTHARYSIGPPKVFGLLLRLKIREMAHYQVVRMQRDTFYLVARSARAAALSPTHNRTQKKAELRLEKRKKWALGLSEPGGSCFLYRVDGLFCSLSSSFKPTPSQIDICAENRVSREL